MKITVYAIAKNEELHVDRWFNSVKDADAVFVLDTGSTDNTFVRLKELATEHPHLNVLRIEIPQFRFDTARNIALSHASVGTDLLLTSDLDEVFEDGAFDKIRKHVAENTAGLYSINLVYTTEADGSPGIVYAREALHNKEFYWKYPVHELLYSEHSHEVSHIDVNTYHLPDSDKPRNYLPLLELAVNENPDDPRCAQYLGREYMYTGEYFIALQWLKKHITMEPHGPFRCESAMYIGDCYFNLHDHVEEALDEAEAWYFRAVSEFNSAREPYCRLAKLYYDCGQWESAIGIIRSAFRIKEIPEARMIIDTQYYTGIWCEHILAASYYNNGQVAEARSVINSVISADKQYPQSFLNDVARIFGVAHVNQPGNDGQTEASGEGSIPEDGEQSQEAVS